MSSRCAPRRRFALPSHPLSATFLSIGLLSAQGIAQAATLGPMLLMSGQGEPLKAEIEIVSIQPGEEDSIAATIAPRLVYERAQLPYPPGLLTAKVQIERREQGKQFIVLSSAEPVSQDNLDLLIELQAGKQSVTRRYPIALASRTTDAQAKAPTTPAVASPPPTTLPSVAASAATAASAAAVASAATAASAATTASPVSAVPSEPPVAAQARPVESPAPTPSRPIDLTADRPADAPVKPAVTKERPQKPAKAKSRVDKPAAGDTATKSQGRTIVVAPGGRNTFARTPAPCTSSTGPLVGVASPRT